MRLVDQDGQPVELNPTKPVRVLEAIKAQLRAQGIEEFVFLDSSKPWDPKGLNVVHLEIPKRKVVRVNIKE